jgi:TolB-like protein/Flp pilus assembly protein TadD
MGDREETPGGAGVPPETARAILEKLLASPHFSNSRRLREFLRFITLKAIAGETAKIDEYLIAFEIYGRDPDYDPKVDSIVRVEANRLRAKLRDYYEAEGRDDAVRIQLPLASYAPVFEVGPQPGLPTVPPAAAAQRTPLRLTLAVTLAAVTTMAALAPLGRRSIDPRSSIAVLPFTNESGLAEKDYFSDGLTERIANQLGRSGKLQVAARSSAERFKDSGGDIRRIGRQLHVDLVLEGGMRFAGESIGISARLYNTHNGRQIWSSEFSRPAAEAPVLQDEISTALAGELQLGRAGADRPPSAMGWTADSGALDLYLQGRYLFNSRKPEDLRKSVQLYDAALRRDPRFAQAYASLAEDYVVLAANEDRDVSQMNILARQSVAHALVIDPNLPEALLTKAATEENPDFAGLERGWRAALAANPSSANGHHWWGLNLLAKGRFSEAEAEIRRAQSLDPLSLHIGANIGAVYYCSRRYRDTVDQERKILDLDPRVPLARLLLARGYEGLGWYAQAEDILEDQLRNGDCAGAMADLGHVYAVSGKPERARHMMDALTRMAQTQHVSPHQLAFIQTGLGNKSEALALLEMSYEQHNAGLAFLGVDPRWDPLRGEPRFQRLVHELSLDK